MCQCRCVFVNRKWICEFHVYGASHVQWVRVGGGIGTSISEQGVLPLRVCVLILGICYYHQGVYCHQGGVLPLVGCTVIRGVYCHQGWCTAIKEGELPLKMCVPCGNKPSVQNRSFNFIFHVYYGRLSFNKDTYFVQTYLMLALKPYLSPSIIYKRTPPHKKKSPTHCINSTICTQTSSLVLC